MEENKVQVGLVLDKDELEKMKKTTRVDIASQAVLSLARLGLEELGRAREMLSAPCMGETR